MIQDTRALLNRQAHTIDESRNRSLRHYTQFEKTILLQLNLSMVLLDADGAKDDIWLRCSSFPTD